MSGLDLLGIAAVWCAGWWLARAGRRVQHWFGAGGRTPEEIERGNRRDG